MSEQTQLVLEFFIETYAENAVKKAIEKESLAKELKRLRMREETDRKAIEGLHHDVAELSLLLKEATSQIETLKKWAREDMDAADWWKTDADDEDTDAY